MWFWNMTEHFFIKFHFQFIAQLMAWQSPAVLNRNYFTCFNQCSDRSFIRRGYFGRKFSWSHKIMNKNEFWFSRRLKYFFINKQTMLPSDSSISKNKMNWLCSALCSNVFTRTFFYPGRNKIAQITHALWLFALEKFDLNIELCAVCNVKTGYVCKSALSLLFLCVYISNERTLQSSIISVDKEWFAALAQMRYNDFKTNRELEWW